MTRRRGRTFFNEFRNLILAWAAAGVIRLLLLTLRYRSIGWSRALLHKRLGGTIFVFWHDSLMLPLGHPSRRGTWGVASPTSDGEFAARIVGCFGVRSLRGSNNKKATSLLLRLVRQEDPVRALALTPDGPRGPRHHFHPGAAWIAARLGWPIIPVGGALSRSWRLKSWDRFRIPKPFARAALVFGPPIHLPKTLRHQDLKRTQAALNAALQDACREAATLCGAPWPD